jgi:fructose-bisphosphate aldolase class I
MSEMFEHVKHANGFIAALDQSGGSTPKALRQYGVDESQYSNEQEMFDRIHEMRTRIITSPSFNGDRVLGAILFENTMDRQIEGVGSSEFLWKQKGVVPFLKVDKGLADEQQGAQMMKPIPGLDELLERAVQAGVFGTKMRSFIAQADADGIEAVVAQQFEIGRQIVGHGLVPIIEPEVDIHSDTKAEAEQLLRDSITRHLDELGSDEHVMLKLSIPTVDDFYRPLIEHANVVRVVALSGGYSRDEADRRLARNHGMIASFSRALTEGLTAQMSDDEFDKMLDETIGQIYAASIT